MQRRIGLLSILTVLLTTLAAVPALLMAPPATAGDPPNTAPHGLRKCAQGGATSPACLRAALKDMKRARAREGIGPMSLPTNFRSLSIPAQLMVLADLDRVDRGRKPVAGLASGLQAAAQTGAQQHTDPAFPAWAREGGSNWASTASSLWAEFLWMYADGPGAGNLDCTKASDAGCYGHRHNILARYHGLVLMGAGWDPAGGATQLFVGSDTHDRADLATWASERRLIPVGVSKRHLRHAGKLTVWASGRKMKVHVTATRGWHVSGKRLTLRAGHARVLRVAGRGHGTLRLTAPHGTVTVKLGR